MTTARTTTDAEDEQADGQVERTGEEGTTPPVTELGATVPDRIRRRSEALADREVEEALRKLEARGDLTDGQREAVHELADGIVESLVAAPARTVAAARAADDEALSTVLELFDPGEEG